VASQASHCQSCPRYFIKEPTYLWNSRGKTAHFEGILSIPAQARLHNKHGFGHKFNLKE
jgi:hypothetical protein